jgi:glutathione-independent formaldehyde dehydrogenase
MKAVVLEETRRISVREVADAQIQEATDALLRITSTAICGTDLHFYEGRMRGLEGAIIGHRLSLDEAPGAFAKFDAREDGYIKVILKPTS